LANGGTWPAGWSARSWPVDGVFLTQWSLPGKNYNKLLKAVPYAVEDQLVDDIEAYHFALSHQAINGTYTVAAVEEKMVEYWHSALQAAGISVEMMMPDVLALPAGGWTVLIESDRAMVRTPQGMFASDIDTLPMLLSNFYDLAGDNKPEAITVYDCGRANHLAVLQANASELPFEIVACGDGLFGMLARDYQPRLALNLLQGDYSVERDLNKYIKPWKTAGILFLIWLGWQVAFNLFGYINLHRQSSALSEQLAQLHKSAFPTGKKPAGISERDDMERRLKEMRKQQASGAGGFAEVLVKAAPVLKEMQGINIKTLRYIDGRMDLELSLKLANQIDTLKERLAQQTGWNVEVQSASSRGEVTDVRLQLRKAS
jgi:general secretion pathway protein L